jgi:hypothetical protein
MKAGSFVSKSRVTSNVINPGSTSTLFATKDGASEVKQRRIGYGPWRYIFMFFRTIFSYIPISFPSFSLQRNVQHSGNAVFHVATSYHLNNVGGKYFSDKNGLFVGCGLDRTNANGGGNNEMDDDMDDGDEDEEEEESENNLVCGEGEHPPLGIDNQIGGKVWSQSMRAVKKWL